MQDIDDGLPPVRSSGSIAMDKKEVWPDVSHALFSSRLINTLLTISKTKKQPAKTHNPNKLKSSDFRAWDKYDANREADKVDKAGDNKKKKTTNLHPLPDIELSEKGTFLSW